MPKIKFTGMEETIRGRYEGRKIKGVKEDGQAWDTFVFKTIKDPSTGKSITNPIIATLSGANVGDMVNIVMEKNGKFWNAKDAVIVGAGDGTTPTATKSAPKSSGSGYAAKRDNGTWRTAESQTRSSAAYLAHNVVESMLKAGVLGKNPKEDLIIGKLQELSEMFFGYFESGRFGIDGELAEVPENLQEVTDSEDGDPGPGEDDDIPF